MALRGIDTQMMITRTNDYAKEVDVMRRGGDVQQSLLTQMGKVKEAHDQQRVLQSPNSEKAELHTGEDADGTGDFHFKKNRKEDEEEQNEDKTPVVDMANNKLDVFV